MSNKCKCKCHEDNVTPTKITVKIRYSVEMDTLLESIFAEELDKLRETGDAEIEEAIFE
jgi:hypothetical protein